MSRVLSFRDLLLISDLSQYNEIELLHPSMDDLVNPYLGKLGFDLDYGIVYEPSKHRDLQGKVAVGFRVLGELNINRRIINSDLCTVEDRFIAAGYQDPSLVRELGPLMGTRLDYRAFHGEEDGEEYEDFLAEDIEPSYAEVTREIALLTAIRDQIRGDIYNEAGSIKSPMEGK